jgi:protein TonB
MECYWQQWDNAWKPQRNFSWAILGSMMAHGLFLAGILLHQPSPGRVVVPVEAVTVTLMQAAPRGGGDSRPGPVTQSQAASPKPKPVCPPPKPRVKSKPRAKVKLTSPPPEPTTAPVIPTPASTPAIKNVKAAPSASATGRASSSGAGALGAGRGGRGTGSGGGVGSGQGRGSGTGNALQGYLWEIRKLLEKQKEYPLMARRRNLEGVVVVALTITAGGQVDASQVSRSSGHNLLDDAARNTIRRVGRFPPFPGDLKRQKLTVEIPLAFRLN